VSYIVGLIVLCQCYRMD